MREVVAAKICCCPPHHFWRQGSFSQSEDKPPAQYLSLDTVQAPEPEDLASAQLHLSVVNLVQPLSILGDLLFGSAMPSLLQELQRLSRYCRDDLRTGRRLSVIHPGLPQEGHSSLSPCSARRVVRSSTNLFGQVGTKCPPGVTLLGIFSVFMDIQKSVYILVTYQSPS